ncbi:hypothetical protein HPB47_002652, partial [Ixodes persulcatus]
AVTRCLTETRRQQKANYDRNSRTLPDIDTGSTTTVYNTLRRTRSAAIVVGHPAPRSYNILTPEGQVRRRTREHLRPATDSRQGLTSTGKGTTGTKQSPSDFNQRQPQPGPQLRRGTRERRPPQRYPNHADGDASLYADFSREKRCSNQREMAPPLSLGCPGLNTSAERAT